MSFFGQRAVNQDSISLQQVLCRKGRVTMSLVVDDIGSLGHEKIDTSPRYAQEKKSSV